MIDTQNTTSPAVTDAAIDAETNRIIAATCVKHGIQPSDLPPGAADDARLQAIRPGLPLKQMLKHWEGISAGLAEPPRRRKSQEDRRVGKECRSRWSPSHYK